MFGGYLSEKLLKKYLQVNCISQIMFFEKLFLSNLLQSKAKIIFFSSLAGSISLRGELSHNKKGGNISYRISKAALNAAIKNISYDLSDSEMVMIALHPGWVKTKSGGEMADLCVDEAAKNIIELVNNISKKDHGNFLNIYGEKLQW